MSFDQTQKVFWLEDFSVLYRDSNYVEFIPRYDSTREEQLNAISRFSFYSIILLTMFNKDPSWYYIPVIILFITVLCFYVHKKDKNGQKKDVDRLFHQRREKNPDIDECFSPDIELIEFEDRSDPNVEVETGYYDSDGKLVMGKSFQKPKYCKYKGPDIYTIDEMMEYDKATCRRPTKDNPFMNPNVTDYHNDTAPAPCNVEDDEIKDEMTVNFNADLYRNVDDIWENKNSQRQFYTIPAASIPTNQKDFALWLYGMQGTIGSGGNTCKEDQQKCLRYTDLRFERSVHPSQY